MLARSRFNKAEGCNILLSKLASNDGHPHLHAFYEWITLLPIKGLAHINLERIRDIRIAIADILEKIKRESPSSYSV
jgi:hypothetical protein